MAGFVFPFFGYNDEKYGRMRRQDLMDLVILRSRENDELKRELESLTAELEERRIIDAGAETIAEAAMRRGKIYQLAHEIADSYVDSVRLKTEQQTCTYEKEKEAHYLQLANVEDEVNDRLMKLETEVNEKLMTQEEESNRRIRQMEQESAQRIAAMEAESEERMARQEAEVKERLKRRESEVHTYCDQMLLEARSNSQRYWDDIQNQIKSYLARQNSKDEPDASRETKEEVKEASIPADSKDVSDAVMTEASLPEESISTLQEDNIPENTVSENPVSEDPVSEDSSIVEYNPMSDAEEDSDSAEVNSDITNPVESSSFENNSTVSRRGTIRTPIIEMEQSDLEELENLIVISN